MTCVGVPVSWPRLERFAAGERSAEIEAHLAACDACRACLDELRADVVALPPLPAASPERAPSRFVRWLFGGGALALAAAAIIFLIIRRGTPADEVPGARVAIKGAGEVVLSIVRDRDGAIAYDPRTFVTTDRLKVRVTCDPGPSIWADVIVYQGGASFPLAPARVPCGNNVTVPGAFRIDTRARALVCVALSTGPAPDRAALGRPVSGQVACAPLAPE
ncbi:MAG TPA: hypothetical protein VL463_17595 [Kofleriaceae bacterium]|nr:hypothetical protein [Kofleriaceae bacterium]